MGLDNLSTLRLFVLGEDLYFSANESLLREVLYRALVAFSPVDVPCAGEGIVVRVTSVGSDVTLQFEGRKAVLDRASLERNLPDLITLLVISKRPELLFLHASAVLFGGRALVFVGASTSGKSTLAAALHQRGAQLLCDDLVPIDSAVGCVSAYPTGQNFRPFTKVLSEQNSWDTGFNHLPEAPEDRAHPIGAFLIMRPENAGENYVDISSALKRKRSLIELCLGTEASDTATHFRDSLCLRNERSFECLPEIAECDGSEVLRPLINHLYTPNRSVRQLLSDMSNALEGADNYILRPGKLDDTVALVLDTCARTAVHE